MKNFSEAMDIKDSLTVEVKLLLKPHGSVPTRCWINGEIMVGENIGAPKFITKQIKLGAPLEVRIKIEREHPQAVEVDMYIDDQEVMHQYQHHATPPTRYIDTNDMWIFECDNALDWLHEAQGHGEIF